MSEHHLDVKAFLGIDNTSDLASVSIQRKGGIYFYEIDNIDIDDAGKIHRRDGYKTSIFTGDNIRSLWANDKICLFASHTNLKKLNTDNTTVTLISDVDETDPFSFVEHGDVVYFTNNSIIGYIDTNTGLPYPFPEPVMSYKTKMVGGHILEWYNSRLYAANGSNLFFSDATVPTRMDTRKNAIAFPSRITMLKAVDDGLYVSDSKNVYFENGGDPISEFVEVQRLDFPAIEGMSAVSVGQDKASRKVAYWMTKNGPYTGYSGGIVTPQQEGLFSIEGLEYGTAIIKSGSYNQFLTIGKFKIGEGGSEGVFNLPASTETSTST